MIANCPKHGKTEHVVGRGVFIGGAHIRMADRGPHCVKCCMVITVGFSEALRTAIATLTAERASEVCRCGRGKPAGTALCTTCHDRLCELDSKTVTALYPDTVDAAYVAAHRRAVKLLEADA